jgi:hypothetical protein
VSIASEFRLNHDIPIDNGAWNPRRQRLTFNADDEFVHVGAQNGVFAMQGADSLAIFFEENA